MTAPTPHECAQSVLQGLIKDSVDPSAANKPRPELIDDIARAAAKFAPKDGRP